MKWLAVVSLLVLGFAGGAFFLSRGGDPVAEAARSLQTAKLTVSGELEGRPLRGSAEVDLRGDRARMELAVSAAGLEGERGEGLDAVLIGDTFYERDRFTEYTDYREYSPWRESRLDPTSTFDPRGLLRSLRAAKDSAERGREEIRETPATRYRTRIRHPSGPRALADIWIDGKGRIVRADFGEITMFVTPGAAVRINEPDLSDDYPQKERSP